LTAAAAALPKPSPCNSPRRAGGHSTLPDAGAARRVRSTHPWSSNRPPAVVVSMLSRSDRNPTPRSSSPVTTSIRCRNDRPSRSSRHTTSASPGRSCSKTHPAAAAGPAPPTHGRSRPSSTPQQSARRPAGQGSARSSTPARAQQARHDRTVPQTSYTPYSRYVGSGHQLCTLPLAAARSSAGRIQSIGRASPDRPTNERLRDVFVASVTCPMSTRFNMRSDRCALVPMTACRGSVAIRHWLLGAAA